jgi:hypothetical protein
MHIRRRAMRLLPIALWRFSRRSGWPRRRRARRDGERDGAAHGRWRTSRGGSGAFPVPRPGTLRTATAAPALSLRPVARDPWAAPRLRWDGHPQDMDWTLATMAALRGPGAALVRTVPRDIADWCPGYEAAGPGQRRAFWAGLVSALAWHESTHRGGRGGRWRALVRAGADLAGDGALSGLPGDERGRRCWTGRRTCAAVSGSWGRRCRAMAWCRGGCAAWRPIGGRSTRRESARTCGNGCGRRTIAGPVARGPAPP